MQAKSRKEAGPSETEAAMRHLMGRLGVDSALIGVPKLARLLGMGASTLYSYIRAGTFFIPYRLVNGTPMVRVDDLLEWYRVGSESESSDCDNDPGVNIRSVENSSPSLAAPPSSPSSERTSERDRGKRARKAQYELADVATREAADMAVDGMVASVLARLERARRKSQ